MCCHTLKQQHQHGYGPHLLPDKYKVICSKVGVSRNGKTLLSIILGKIPKEAFTYCMVAAATQLWTSSPACNRDSSNIATHSFACAHKGKCRQADPSIDSVHGQSKPDDNHGRAMPCLRLKAAAVATQVQTSISNSLQSWQWTYYTGLPSQVPNWLPKEPEQGAHKQWAHKPSEAGLFL